MGPVDNEPLQQHTGDLLLDDLLRGLGEEVEQDTTEVVGVVVGIAKLVGNGIEEKVSALSIQVRSQMLENIHRCTVSDGRGYNLNITR